MLDQYCGEYHLGGKVLKIKRYNNELILKDYHYNYKFRLLPILDNVFLIEDNILLLFKLGYYKG